MFGLVATDNQKSNLTTTGTLTSGIITTAVANLELINYALPGGSRVISKTLYAPSEFKNLTAPLGPGFELLYFNVEPGLPNSTKENDAKRFVLPHNASVIGGLLTNNGTPIVTTDAIYFSVFPIAYVATNGQLSSIISAFTMANINITGGISAGFNNPGYSNLAALGSAGASVPTLTEIVTPTKPLSIGLQLSTVNPTTPASITSGDLALVLTYILE
jgi:hypothetical protein